MFQSGHAEATFDLLREYRLFGEMFPATEEELQQTEPFLQFVRAALVNSDRRVAEGKSVTPMFLIGVFLWEPIRRVAEMRLSEEKMSDSQALSLAAYEVVSQQQRRISIPKRFTVPMREMLALQPRFAQMKGRRALNLLEHRRFRAAYEFMMLLAEVGAVQQDVADFWTAVQQLSVDDRAREVQIESKPRSRRRRRRGKRARPRDDG